MERVFSSCAEAWKIGPDDFEQPVFSDVVVFVPEDVSEGSDFLPGLVRHQVQRHVAEFLAASVIRSMQRSTAS